MIKNDVKPGKEFKKQAVKAVAAIVLFMMVFVLIGLAAVAFMGLCMVGAVMLLKLHLGWITILIGLGLASLGVLVMVFLFKFLFKSHKTDLSHLVQVTRAQEPALFAVIDQVVGTVGTSLPKKVYLSAEVNAAVFYDSNFFSMFLPVRKNLQIGLGLVNSLTASELKGVLAHEFGHFSQRTMKLGSYVYNVNQVIFNMLYENDSYDRMITRWAQVHSVMDAFVSIAVKIVHAIQWVLQKMYVLVNLSYMSLSREMEFHADDIAAAANGSEASQTSLLRIDLADFAYHSVMDYYNARIDKNLKSANVYLEQYEAIKLHAEDAGIPLRNGFPMVTLSDLNRFNKSKLVVKNQWASHPSIAERVQRLGHLAIPNGHYDHRPANQLLANATAWQQRFTERLFSNADYSGDVGINALSAFVDDLRREQFKSSFAKMYNGYYNHKNPEPFEVEEIKPEGVGVNTVHELFSKDKVELVYKLLSLKSDIAALEHLINMAKHIKTVDYDGHRYKRTQWGELVSRLKNLQIEVVSQIKANDMAVYTHFANLEMAEKGTSELKGLYGLFFEFDKEYDRYMSSYYRLMEATQFVREQTPFDTIRRNFKEVERIESELKQQISTVLAQPEFAGLLTDTMKADLNKYLFSEWVYFEGAHYNEDNLELLFKALGHYAALMSERYLAIKRKLLNYQCELVGEMEVC